MSLSPKIIFVDGPTGVGKDYFIEKLYNEYKTKFPNKKIKCIAAKDIVFSTRTITEDRKYTYYNTETELIEEIYSGHIKLLNFLYSEITKNNFDLILVNRSFFSFIVYNVLPVIRKNNIKKFAIELEEYKKCYKEFFSSIFKRVPVVFIRLDINGDSYTTILGRLKERNDEKVIDTAWIKDLIYDFKNLDKGLLDMFMSTECLDSSSYSYVLNKYF